MCTHTNAHTSSLSLVDNQVTFILHRPDQTVPEATEDTWNPLLMTSEGIYWARPPESAIHRQALTYVWCYHFINTMWLFAPSVTSFSQNSLNYGVRRQPKAREVDVCLSPARNLLSSVFHNPHSCCTMVVRVPWVTLLPGHWETLRRRAWQKLSHAYAQHCCWSPEMFLCPKMHFSNIN